MHFRGSVAVIGLGYVGLPLSREACNAGWRVLGIDTSESVVSALLDGKSTVDDITDSDVVEMQLKGMKPTRTFNEVPEVDVVVICVPTPLSADGSPDLSAVKSAVAEVAQHLRRGQLVVLESTTYPGTTEEVVIPILEASGLKAGQDFAVAYSPERVDPGNTQYSTSNTPKVVGGLTSNCTIRATDFYQSFVDTVVTARGLREAEMAKLLENTYRHVNIALVNEMLRFCHLLDIDLRDAIRCASTKPFGFQAFFPGPGVGGHCIPIDPNYLSHRVRTHLGQPFRFVELAQEINSAMPQYVIRRAQDLLNRAGLAVSSSHILIVGVTYKPNVSDQRESPAEPIADGLLALGAELAYVDPFVASWSPSGAPVRREQDLKAALRKCDLAVVLQDHERLDLSPIVTSGTLTLDTQGVLSGSSIESL